MEKYCLMIPARLNFVDELLAHLTRQNLCIANDFNMEITSTGLVKVATDSHETYTKIRISAAHLATRIG